MRVLKGMLLTAVTITLAGLTLAANEPPQMTAEQKAVLDAVTKAGTPGPQHAFLASTAGSYAIKVKSWDDPKGPATEETGTATRTMALDGRVMVEDLSCAFQGVPFMGHGMTGFDNVSGKFWSTWNDSMSTGIALSEGTCDAKHTCTFIGHWNDPVKKKPVKSRMISRWPNPTTEVFEMYGPGKDGKEMKMMEMTYTKNAQ